MLQYIKLVTGEEILGEVVAEDDNTLDVRNTVSVVLRPMENDRLNYAFVPWGSLCDVKKLEKSSFIFQENPNEEVITAHKSLFDPSPIITPESGQQLIV